MTANAINAAGTAMYASKRTKNSHAFKACLQSVLPHHTHNGTTSVKPNTTRAQTSQGCIDA